MNNIELKPCPFCGETTLESCEKKSGIIYQRGAFIVCQSCGARGPSVLTPTNYDSIWLAWNTRGGYRWPIEYDKKRHKAMEKEQ